MFTRSLRLRDCAFVCTLVIYLGILSGAVARADETHKWVIMIHAKGEEKVRTDLPLSNKLHREVDELSARCKKDAKVDLTSYAPSLRIESELERIDFHSKTIIYSTRKSVDSSWFQSSLRASDSDRMLRRRLIEFCEREKM